MQWPAFRSETDPHFQEMLSRALAVPDNPSAGGANDAAPDVEAAKPTGRGSDGRAVDPAIDLEACKRDLEGAREWLRSNRHKWAGPAAAAGLDLEACKPTGQAPDPTVDLEACKRDLQAAREWLRRNRHKWAGPGSAFALAVAPKKARSKTIRTPPARTRSRFTARRQRVARRRPHHRARLVSRAGPCDGPAPDDPNAPTADLPPEVNRAMTARVPSGTAALREHRHVGAFSAEQPRGAKASPPRSATSKLRVAENDASSLARGEARKALSWGPTLPSTLDFQADRPAPDFATDLCWRCVSCAEADPHPLAQGAFGHRVVEPSRASREASATGMRSWGTALPSTLQEFRASCASAHYAAKIAPSPSGADARSESDFVLPNRPAANGRVAS